MSIHTYMCADDYGSLTPASSVFFVFMDNVQYHVQYEVGFSPAAKSLLLLPAFLRGCENFRRSSPRLPSGSSKIP